MKEYISPNVKVINIYTEQSLLTASGDVNNEKQDDVMGGSNRRGIWSED